jgi:hypothetical protein
LVNDRIYERYKNRYDQLPSAPPTLPEIELGSLLTDADCLISALPLTQNIDDLYELYKTLFVGVDREAVACAMHDIALYQIPFGLPKTEFIALLKQQFMKSGFIKKLLAWIDEDERYFGEIKAWIQEKCADVPIPSRRDLTGNIQVLYRWIADLSDGKYKIDKPNYSERISRANKNN